MSVAQAGTMTPCSIRTSVALSIVICTHNRAQMLGELLEILKPQLPGQPVELIVVDSASGPADAGRVREAVAAVPGARLVRMDQPGVSQARNESLRQASAAWLAFLDDDEVPGPNWVLDALELLNRLPADCGACGGNVLPVFPEGLGADIGPRWRTYLSTIDQAGEFDQTSAPSFGIGHSVIRVEAVRAVGGFDQRLGRVGGSLLSGEEVLLVDRMIEAGWRIWHSDRISVGHLIERERLERAWVWRRAFWEGVTTAGLLRIRSRPTLHMRMVPIALKALPLALAVPLSPRRWDVDLRYAFVRGFLKEYFGREHA